MISQLVTTLIHVVTATPSHTGPAPVATPVTVITSTISQGFAVLKLTPW
jgi:hypothetical protein